jgi:hypothetical protein
MQDQWIAFEIAGYLGFYDLPRTILAVDASGRCWVFDCPFDERRDDYAPAYTLHEVKEPVPDAAAFLRRHCARGHPEGIGSIPVEALAFDATRRRSFTVRQRAFPGAVPGASSGPGRPDSTESPE